MARKTKHLPRFNDPSILRELDRHRLHGLLLPHAVFFAGHGVAIPADPDGLDVDAVGAVILQPHDDTPYELFDALTHIDEMATPQGMEKLQSAASMAGIRLGADVDRTPADLALQLWIDAPELLRRQHAEHVVMGRRARESFMPRPDAPRIRLGDLEEALSRLESMVQSWYRNEGRGEGAAVMVFPEEQALRLVIRHGGPYQRKGCLQHGGPASVHFRPMEFAYAVLTWDTCELAVNCSLKSEREFFRRALGECVFGQPGFFSVDQKYTLEPLRDGKACLRCPDVPGIQRVVLVGVKIGKRGPYRRADTITADDVFQALLDGGDASLEPDDLVSATLHFFFNGTVKPRPVTICAGNRAQYTRDGDSELVERFLAARGFMREGAHVAAVATA